MSLQINADWGGKDSEPRYYQTLGYGNIGGVQGKPLLNSEIVYIRQNPTTENPFGLGQLEVAFAAINRKLGVSDYAGKMASNAQPENLLVMGGMTNEQLLTFRQYWRNEIEGQGQTPVFSPPVGAEADVLKLRGTDDKSLFIGYQELLIREIATAFDINAMSLGVHQDVNRSTSEVIDDADWENAVVPMATLYAAYITRETIEGKLGFSQLEFRFLGLKRDDKLAEAQIYEIEFTNGASTPNEYRARNNMPPLDSPWGDLTGPDVEIAKAAARGAAQVDDPKLKAPASPKPKPKGK
jgi:Phage portal protein